MMKKYIFIIFLLLCVIIPIGGFNIKEPSQIYHHFGTFSYPHNTPNTVTSYEIYVVKQGISEYENRKSYLPFKYKYIFIGVSKSIYYGKQRNTFIEGFQILNTKTNETLNYYPLNFYIEKQGSVLYTIKSNDERPSFFISWTSSYYDARQ